MKVGDLVRPKRKYSCTDPGLGLIVKVEEGFYAQLSLNSLYDRLTIYWAHGETTKEPCAYMEKIND